MNNKREIIVILDVDGVLAQFHETATMMINELFGRNISINDFERWGITSILKTEFEKEMFLKELQSPGFATSIMPYPEAQNAVKKLRELEVSVIFATSPNFQSLTWMRERQEWLEHYYSANVREIAQIHKKHLLIGDVFVDDRVKNVEQWAKANPGKKAILWDAPYNKNITHLYKTSDWDVIINEVKSLLVMI
jgi:5'(3')-deoxyribonucleotidase